MTKFLYFAVVKTIRKWPGWPYCEVAVLQGLL